MILLVNPDLPPGSPWGRSRMLPPLGLLYIAAVLEKGGFEVEIFNNYLLNKPIDEIKSKVSHLNPEIIGISCNSVNYGRCVEIARAARHAAPKSVVVVGGPHATCMPETLLMHEEIDYVIVGEGERSMLELAKCIVEKRSSHIASIPGIAYRAEGRVIRNPQSFIEDLDWVPIPARHLIDLSSYERNIDYLPVKPVDVLNVIRGCPFKCRFCETKGIWGSKPRAFSPKRVVEELEILIENHGTQGAYFIGDNFTINGKWVKEVCDLIKMHKLSIEWVCDTRVDLVSRELLRCMRAAGCRTIWFGIESGSPQVLSMLNKGISLEQASKAVKLCREEGIKVACSFMLGVPGETLKDMEATLNFALRLNPDWCQFNVYIACPGSSLYDEVVENGLYDRRSDFVYFVKTEEFNYDALMEIQKRFHRAFHRSPRRLIKRAYEHAKTLFS